MAGSKPLYIGIAHSARDYKFGARMFAGSVRNLQENGPESPESTLFYSNLGDEVNHA
jgi:hypothetical protein